MTEFSTFPTDHWANLTPQALALRWKRGCSTIFPSLNEQISWQQLSYLIAQTSHLFARYSLQPQALIAYKGTNKLLGVLCYLSAIRYGLKILMLNPMMPEAQCHHILQRNGVAMLLTDAHFANIQENSTACHIEKVDLTQPATLTLTSGSSSEPKAVVHCVKNHLKNAEGVCELMAFSSQHSWLLSLPLFHVSGQGIIWRWLYAGATLVIQEDKADFWQALMEVSHVSLVPTQLQRYLAQSLNPSQVQHILLGGAFIPKALIEQAKLRGLTTYAGYGMTEMASTICAVKNEVDNVGSPLKHREVKIEGNEIWVKGDTLALGYWQDQHIISITNEQGWLATKDKGYFCQGKLFVEGRLDNMFISGGENIQPEEIEKVLFSSDLLKQIFILPIPDQEFGYRPIAVVEFKQEFNPQVVENITNFAKKHLEKFKLPLTYLNLLDLEGIGSSQIKISRKKLQQKIAQKGLPNNV